ncbi:MAG: hypothetical protein D6B27_01190 [Gammaproteobacteria bacterium]|nr:MAG: hypothetical protein D6B27_01190 [Gammaproteobacteria bacterium]
MQMLLPVLVGLLTLAVGFIALANTVSKEKSLSWGVFALICPPVSLFFAPVYWSKARLSFFIMIIGAGFLAASLYFGGYTEVKRHLEIRGIKTNISSYVLGYEIDPEIDLAENTENIEQNIVPIEEKEPKSKAQLSHNMTYSEITYNRIDPESARGYLGSKVVMSLSNGKKASGVLLSSQNGKITLKIAKDSGHVSYIIPIAKIRNMKVERVVRKSV